MSNLCAILSAASEVNHLMNLLALCTIAKEMARLPTVSIWLARQDWFQLHLSEPLIRWTKTKGTARTMKVMMNSRGTTCQICKSTETVPSRMTVWSSGTKRQTSSRTSLSHRCMFTRMMRISTRCLIFLNEHQRCRVETSKGSCAMKLGPRLTRQGTGFKWQSWTTNTSRPQSKTTRLRLTNRSFCKSSTPTTLLKITCFKVWWSPNLRISWAGLDRDLVSCALNEKATYRVTKVSNSLWPNESTRVFCLSTKKEKPQIHFNH